jgi:hypothetical protein
MSVCLYTSYELTALSKPLGIHYTYKIEKNSQQCWIFDFAVN